jgi:hypothetical protein
VRWELLFADLEAFAEASERAVFAGEVAERERAERAELRLADRLRAHVGGRLTFSVLGGDRLTGRLADVGAEWILLEEADSVLLPLTAVTGVDGLSRVAAIDTGKLARRIGWTVLLRRLARDRALVRLTLVDGGTAAGTIDRVGADHLDLAQHPLDEARRAGAVRGVRVIPLSALVTVRAAV